MSRVPVKPFPGGAGSGITAAAIEWVLTEPWKYMSLKAAIARPRTNWLAVLVIYGAGVLAAAQIGKLTPLGSSIRLELGLSLGGFGAAISLVQMLSVIFGVGGGLLAQRIGARRLLVTGLLVCGAGGLAASAAWSGSSFLALRVLEGLGFLFVVVSAPTMLATLAHERDRNMVLSIWGTFVPVGFAISGALAGLWDGLWSWRVSAAIFSIAVAAIAFAVHRAAPAGPAGPAGRDGPRPGILDAYRIRPLVLLTLGFAAFAVVNSGTIALLPTHLIEVRGWRPGAAGSVAGSLILFNVPGSLAMGWFLHALPKSRWHLVAVPAVAALSVALIWLGEMPVSAMLAAGAVAMTAQGMIAALCFASLPRAAGEARMLAPGNGLIVQMGSLGATVGPPALGYFAAEFGWGLSGLALAACMLVSGMLVFSAVRR